MSKRRRRKHHSVQSQERRPSHRPVEDLQEIFDRVDDLVLSGHARAAVELLEPLLESHPREAELYYYLGYARANAGDTWQALADYEHAQKLDQDPSYWLPLGILYLEAGQRVHALRTLRRAIKHQSDFLSPADVPGMVAALEETVAELAQALGRPAERVEEGLYHMERGRRALTEGDYPAGIAASRQAIKLLGDWPPPHNNLSLALFWSGQPQEAITTAQEVLAHAPDNIQALGNAVRYLAWTGQETEARELWRRLKDVVPPDGDSRRKIVEAAATVGDDEVVYRLLQPLAGDASRRERESSSLTAHEQFYLAVAEANTGRQREARRRLRVLGKEWPGANELLKRLGSDRLYYFHSIEIVPGDELAEFLDLVQHQKDIPVRRFRREVERFVACFPQVVLAAEKLIVEEGLPDAGIAALVAVGTPRAYAVLRRFGLSQVGEDEVRMQVLFRLMEAGEIDEDDTLRVWLDGEWRETRLRIRETPEEEGYDPEVADLLNRGVSAQQEGDQEQAEQLFRQALALEPHAKQAYNNLGAIYAKRGEHDRARAMFQQALEIDPLYSIPRCNLASYLVDDGDFEGAEAMLSPLSDAPPIHHQDVAFYFYVHARILLGRKEYDDARRALRRALKASPDYVPAQQMLENLDARILLWEAFDSFAERQRQRDQAKRARMQAQITTPDPALADALSIYTKDVLTSMAYLVLPYGGWSTLRKAELLQEIVEALSDPDILATVVAQLSDDARAALRQVLASGGMIAWKDFDARYGNDLDESPHWKWHEPEQTMSRLRARGLLAESTVATKSGRGKLLVTIPVELRSPLQGILD